MKTKDINLETLKLSKSKNSIVTILTIAILSFFMFTNIQTASAHCDSYDGPVIQDAEQALATNNVDLVFKWISTDQVKEVTDLFKKTYNLKKGDKEVYEIVKTHFFETLVRLHRETEGAPYTGLKPAGTTKPIIYLSDKAIKDNDIESLLGKLNNHIASVVKEKYNKVSALNKTKNESAEKGREFVSAYVDYTHTLEAIENILAHQDGEKSAEKASGHNH
ncbi:MAG: DUF6448 family protein [Dysgonamonadaceae bacterium]|nr:DUF6448 family protein [Dysgonamonadaceae bacterium]MDD3900245.1 DUF6448 family protein [Dysgonamonadaceae bacterium]MDD4398467.1 DUF6448 family protein [Dysgonamonadaceae bacterium]